MELPSKAKVALSWPSIRQEIKKFNYSTVRA